MGELLATSDQAKDLLDQIDAVTRRGQPLMDRFFFVGTTDALPESVASTFPQPDDECDKIEFAYLFAHVYTGTDEPVTNGLAGMLTLSRHEYLGESLLYDSSIIYRVMAGVGAYSLEQQISYERGSTRSGRVFRDDEVEAMAAYQEKLAREAQNEQAARAVERPLGLLAVYGTVADDLIAFAKHFNPDIT